MKWVSIVAFIDYGRTAQYGGQSHFWLFMGITAIVLLGGITALIWLKHKKRES